MKFSLRKGLFRVCVLATVAAGVCAAIAGTEGVMMMSTDPMSKDPYWFVPTVAGFLVSIPCVWLAYWVLLFVLGGFFPRK